MMVQFYTLSRPGEIAEMKWDWIDFDNDVIRFPAEIMKTGRVHEVPMSKQLKLLLQGIHVFMSMYLQVIILNARVSLSIVNLYV